MLASESRLPLWQRVERVPAASYGCALGEKTMGLGSALSRLRRFKNTTRLGNAVIAPAYDGLRTLRQRPIRFDAGILRSVARLSPAQKSALMTA
jgi:hypothetical protein